MKPKKKPTTAKKKARPSLPMIELLVSRIYRRQIQMEKDLQLANEELYATRITVESLASGQKMLSERVESVISDLSHMGNVLDARIDTLAPIVKHCERLMREKVALQERTFEAEWRAANNYMAAPLRPETSL